jgi:Calcineurin-like phosphoesterase
MKRYLLSTLFLIPMCIHTWGTSHEQPKKKDKWQIAVISDPHIQDTTHLRSMDDQLHSTRLFNENYFAFLAALNDAASRQIRWVLLSGDMTDNGQQLNIQLLHRILADYSARYGMHFFAMTGNHDPSRPLTTNDSLGEMKCWGYQEIMDELSDMGFYPRKEYIYWESPFSSYTCTNYAYDLAIAESGTTKRNYSWKNLKPHIPDASYLVEPVKGLWLLALDASVYFPQKVVGDSVFSFGGARVGYTQIFQEKPYLLPWIQKVTQEAKRQHKTLITFSHYPMLDYNHGATKYIRKMAAPGGFDLDRLPSSGIADTLADAGIGLHFGGHIHLNDEAVHISKKGNRLTNIQVPSTAGYIPAYKVVNIENGKVSGIETVVLDSVPSFDHFFAKYQLEHDSLASIGKNLIWDEAILTSTNYKQFCAFHLKELVRLRYVNDFIPIVREKFIAMTAEELFKSVGLTNHKPMDWSGLDMLVDFFKLRFGGKLTKKEIQGSRLDEYQYLMKQAMTIEPTTELEKFLHDFSNAFTLLLKDE